MNVLLRNFTIRTRMMAAIAMVLALLGLVGGTGLWSLQRLSAASEQFISGTHANLERLGELRSAMGDLRRFEKDLMLNATDAAKVAEYRAKWAAAGERARSHGRALIDGADRKSTRLNSSHG